MVKITFHVITDKNAKGYKSELIVQRNVSIIGREDCDLSLDDPFISRQHVAIILHPDGLLRIRDLKSKNGAFVNNKRIIDAPLGVGDTVKIGRFTLTVKEIEGVDSASEGRTAIYDLKSLYVEDNPTTDNAALLKTKEMVLHGWPGGYDCMPNTEKGRFTDYKPKE